MADYKPETIEAVARVLHAREGGGTPFELCPYCPTLAVEVIETFLAAESSRPEPAGVLSVDSPKRKKHRATVGVDVDGVLHSYTSGWQGADQLPDPPIAGAIEWLEQITKDFDVTLVSTRCETPRGCAAVMGWLQEHGVSEAALERISATSHKPPALVYIDDRAWRFTGANFPTAQEVREALPWWKSDG